MANVFLCHSTEDKAFVDRLAADLRAQGMGVWFDKWEIVAGDSIFNKINDGLAAHDYLAVVLSPASVSSEWVKMELGAAMTSEIDKRQVVVIPLLYVDCEIPPLLASRRYVRFTGDYDSALGEFILAIQKHEARRKGTVRQHGEEYPVAWLIEHLSFDVNLVDRDGRRAHVRKRVRGIALEPSSSYVHKQGGEGPIEELIVVPGFIEKVYQEEGQTFAVQRFDEVVRRDQQIDMSVSYLMLDSFMNSQEYWAVGIGLPVAELIVTIRFPLDRPPTSYGAYLESAYVPGREDPIRPTIVEESGRPTISWKKQSPGLMQRYRVTWEW